MSYSLIIVQLNNYSLPKKALVPTEHSALKKVWVWEGTVYIRPKECH